MPVTIDDEGAMRRMELAVSELDGSGVARGACELFRSGKHALVRRVCLRTCHLAHPRHCRALIDALVHAPRARAARNMSDALATIVAGARERAGASDSSAHAPRSLPKRPRETIAAAARAEDCPIHNIGALPARMGREWGGLADLVVRACADRVGQEDAIANPRLEELLRRPPASHSQARPEDFVDALRLAVIQGYTRTRTDRDRAALAAGEMRREAAPPPKSVRIDDPAFQAAAVGGGCGGGTYVRDVS